MKNVIKYSIVASTLLTACASIISDEKLSLFTTKTSCDRYVEIFHNIDDTIKTAEAIKLNRIKRLGYAHATKQPSANCTNPHIESYQVEVRSGSSHTLYIDQNVKPMSQLDKRNPSNFGIVDGVLNEVMMIEPEGIKAFK